MPTAIGFLAGSTGIRASFTYLSIATLVAALFVALLFSGRIYRSDAADPSATLDD